MRISAILSSGRIEIDYPASSKKAVLEKLASLVSCDTTELDKAEVFDNLVARERLGSTGLGHGVAIPHCRVNHTQQTLGALLLTRAGVNFDAIDNQPVDLFFALCVPLESTEEHLAVLAALASMFSNGEFRNSLRACRSAAAAMALVEQWQPAE